MEAVRDWLTCVQRARAVGGVPCIGSPLRRYFVISFSAFVRRSPQWRTVERQRLVSRFKKCLPGDSGADVEEFRTIGTGWKTGDRCSVGVVLITLGDVAWVRELCGSGQDGFDVQGTSIVGDEWAPMA